MADQSVTRYQAGRAWSNKGLFWMPFSIGLGIIPVALVPVQIVVEDHFWSWVIVAAGCAVVLVQFAALGRQIYCYRRAKKIWGIS